MATRAGCEIGETPNSAGCDKYTLRCFLMLFSSNQMLFKPLYAFVLPTTTMISSTAKHERD